MAESEQSYRLVVFDAPDDPKAARDLIARVTGLHPTEAMVWVARAPGVLPRPLSERETRALLDGLFDLGVPAEAWRADRLPKLGPPRNIKDADCLADGFRVKGLRGEPTHWVPWEKIEIVSAGRVPPENGEKVIPPGGLAALADGLSGMFRIRAMNRRDRSARKSADPVAEVVIVRRDPLIAFRAVADAMSYASLGERLRPSAVENFPLFLGDLCSRASWAHVTVPTLGILEGRIGEDLEFDSTQALLDYTTLRLLWSWYRRDRDAQTEEDTDP
ncbi:MAG: hypothetical protein NVSMB14_11320 [Isosphaeraceae bacterium]